MHNHVRNILKFKNLKEGQVDILIDNLTTEDEGKKYFDFNKIIPMPKELEVESSSYEEPAIKLALYYKQYEQRDKIIDNINSCETTDISIEKMIDLDEIRKIKENQAKRFVPDDTEKKLGIKTLLDLGRVYINNILKYGYTSWYDWSIEHWGTKWNAYDQQIIKGKTWVKFIFSTAWSMPLPIYKKLEELNLDFEVRFADENIGNNCGKMYYINKEETLESKENNRDFANRVWRE